MSGVRWLLLLGVNVKGATEGGVVCRHPIMKIA
jgi:hypothetical protein